MHLLVVFVIVNHEWENISPRRTRRRRIFAMQSTNQTFIRQVLFATLFWCETRVGHGKFASMHLWPTLIPTCILVNLLLNSGQVCSKSFRIYRYRRICFERFQLYTICSSVLSTKPWSYNLYEDLEVCEWGYRGQYPAGDFFPEHYCRGGAHSWSDDNRCYMQRQS